MANTLTEYEKNILFSDFEESFNDYDRETIDKYSQNTRGSVRLATGRFYTSIEMAERAKKAFSVKF